MAKPVMVVIPHVEFAFVGDRLGQLHGGRPAKLPPKNDKGFLQKTPLLESL